jgi:hypothetical protein
VAQIRKLDKDIRKEFAIIRLTIKKQDAVHLDNIQNGYEKLFLDSIKKTKDLVAIKRRLGND